MCQDLSVESRLAGLTGTIWNGSDCACRRWCGPVLDLSRAEDCADRGGKGRLNTLVRSRLAGAGPSWNRASPTPYRRSIMDKALPTSSSQIRRAARRGLVLYLAVVVILSAPLQTGVILTHAFQDQTTSIFWMTALMSTPALASVVARLARQESFSDVSFRLGGRPGRRALSYAVALPFLIGSAAYGCAWLTGLVGSHTPALPQWAGLLVAMLVVNVFLCFGEELGWRGYMVTRLVDAGVPAPLLVSALIWGVWHVPLILWGGFVEDSPSSTFSTLMLLGTTTSLGYVLARLRMDTGSVWPPYALHVVWNVVIQVGFDPWVIGTASVVWVGEFGLLTVAALTVAALLHARRPGPADLSQPAVAGVSRAAA